MRQGAKQALLFCALTLLFWCGYPSVPSRAEMLLSYSPEELATRSDLIVLGEETGQNSIRVIRVLKGKRSADKPLKVADLDRFKPKLDTLIQENAPAIAMTKTLVIFLDQRTWPHLKSCLPRVVWNGVYRQGKIGKEEGWFGYEQFDNPGDYQLVDKPMYKDLDTIEKEIKKGVKSAEVRRSKLVKELASNNTFDSWRLALAQLEEITRFDDIETVRTVLELDVSDDKKKDLPHFARVIQVPESWKLLKALFERTQFIWCLECMGELGQPQARGFLEDTAHSENPEHCDYAIRGLNALYLALVNTGPKDEVETVKESLLKVLAEKVAAADPFRYSYYLAVIPDSRAIDLLKKAEAKWIDPKYGVIEEIRKHVQACKDKIKILNETQLAKPPP